MKITTLLNETQFTSFNDTISFSDLTPIQINILRKLSHGLIEYESATPREQLTIDELEDLGLVVQGAISPAGEKMVEVSDSEGMSSYAKEAGKRDAALGRTNGTRRGVDDDLTAGIDDVSSGANDLRF